MKNLLKFTVLFFVLVSLSSCFINKSNVNGLQAGKGIDLVKYDKKKQLYVLWGLAALKHPEVKVPAECGYRIKTSFNGADVIVSILTAGIFSMRTVKIEVLKDSPCDPKIIKQERHIEKEESHPGK
jgi:hypothetical protein